MSASPSYDVDRHSPFGLALQRARHAADRRDAASADRHYADAVRKAGDPALTADDPGLAADVAVEHVSRLRALDRSDLALAAGERHRATPPTSGASLVHLVTAETRVARGDLSGLRRNLDTAPPLGEHPPLWGTALRHRLEGLAAGHEGRFTAAVAELETARAAYTAAGDRAAVAAVEADLRRLDLRRGTDRGIGAAPADGSPADTPDGWLAHSESLRLHGRYEAALTAIDRALGLPIDETRRFYFLEARTRLLCVLHEDDAVAAALPELRAAAGTTLDAGAARAAAERFADGRSLPRTPLTGTDAAGLAEVRGLAAATRAEEAESLLLRVPAPVEPDRRWSVEWELTAGEVAMAFARRAFLRRDDAAPRLAGEAAAHFAEAVRHSSAASTIGLRVEALHRLGAALMDAGRADEAVAAWARAHAVEEEIASWQPSDAVSIRLLQAAPDQFDERIAAAHRALEDGDRGACASIGIAVEAAQGAAMLPRIMPAAHVSPLRRLPAPGEIHGARRWLLRALRGMPADQVVWMVHAAPDHVHHVVLGRRSRFGRRTIAHTSVRRSRVALAHAVDDLKRRWSSSGRLEVELQSGEFDRAVRRVVTALGIDALPPFGAHVRRIAVVAGGELSEVPFGLLPVPGGDGELLGLTYALSDLPCLAVRRPLRRRGRSTRGRSGLLVQPIPADAPGRPDRLLAAAPLPRRTSLRRATLDRDEATPAGLRATLAERHPHRVRIDSHAAFREKARDALLHLNPPRSAEGRVSPADLASMDFSGTGTLCLAACETGMTTRIGREERTGFVRSGLLAGCAAVVAARWEVLDDVAAHVLDRFEAHLAHAPRDVALLLALRAEAAREAGPATGGVMMYRHPARWAAFTLYGDAGHQTDHGPLRRAWQRRRSTPAPTGSPA